MDEAHTVGQSGRSLNKDSKVVVISGPVTSGKTETLAAILKMARSGASGLEKIDRVITSTTRQPRPGEVNGDHYHFYDESVFTTMRREGRFIETAKYAEHFYGSERGEVQRIIDGDKVPILNIELNGASAYRHECPGALIIFLMPPKAEQLRGRIMATRPTSDVEDVSRRMDTAMVQMYKYKEVATLCLISPDGGLPATILQVACIIKAYIAGEFPVYSP
jgi:guanylate kinase